MYKLTAQVVGEKRTPYMYTVHVDCTCLLYMFFSTNFGIFSTNFAKLVEKIPKLVEKNMYSACVRWVCTYVRYVCAIGCALTMYNATTEDRHRAALFYPSHAVEEISSTNLIASPLHQT